MTEFQQIASMIASQGREAASLGMSETAQAKT